MAEDKSNSSLSSETPGTNESDGSISRRKTTGKQNSPDNDKRIPHYLRASTGSCHDFCKYGRKHDFEPKPKLPLLRRIKKPQNQKLNSAEATVGEGMKVTAVKQKPSDDSEVHFPAPPEVIKEVVFLQPKEVETSPVQDSSSESVIPKMEKKIKNLPAKVSPPMHHHQAKVSKHSSSSKTLGVKPNARRNSDSMGGERNCDTKSGRKIVASGASQQRLMEPLIASSNSKSSLNKARNLGKSMKSSLKPVKNEKNRMREADTNSEEKVSEKTLHVIKMESKGDLVEPAEDGEIIASLSPPSLLLPEPSSTSHSPDSYIESNSRKTLTKAKRVVSKLDTPSPVKLKFRRGKVLDIRYENNGPRRLTFRKARLLVKNQDSKTETKDKLVESMCDDHIISSPPSCEKGGGQDGKEGSGLANSKGYDKKITLNSKGAGRNQNRTLKKGNVIVSKLDNPLPVKLKFKRGTVVNLQHENNSPRRLGFVRGRHLRENQESRSVVKKNPKKIVERGENSTSLNPGKVVLRHQDVQGKKDAQGLFNNVIEETASKLVESNKSKVKALVGAFETVISLQEKKPSAHAIS